MGEALALGSPWHFLCSQMDWGALNHPIKEMCPASCHSWTEQCQTSAFLPWTSMTVRAPRVSLAPLLSFPRTSSTICAICSLLFCRKSWVGHRKKHSVKMVSPLARPILRVDSLTIQWSKPDLDVIPATNLFFTSHVNLKMDLVLIKRRPHYLSCFIFYNIVGKAELDR